MVKITKELLKKRAEHNEGILSSLQEITLHQYDIQKIEVIQSYCKHLKILYLQNNLIDKIENLFKLRELQYLNLGLNNITKIEGLNTCESLNKLDLTLNFIDLDTFEESINNLKDNIFLTDLNLTGNPCSDFNGYRLFIIHSLPQLKKLDSVQITKTEIIKARQIYQSILERLKIKQKEVTELKQKNLVNKDQDDNKSNTNLSAHSIAARKAAYLQDKEREQKQKEEDEINKKKNPFVKPPDVLKEFRKNMCNIAKEGINGELPKQRNIGKYEFRMEGTDNLYEENVRVIIEAPKYLDTSEIFVDIHPFWFQVIIKNKSLLLHIPTEIKVSKSRVRRVMCNGWLELIMPKLTFKVKRKDRFKKKQNNNTKANLIQPPPISNDANVELDDTDIDFDENDVPPLE